MQKIYIYSISILFLFVTLNTFPVSAKEKNKNKQSETKQKLTPEERQKFDYYFYNAIDEKVLGNYAESLDFLSYCLKLDSTNAVVLNEFGNFYNSFDQKSKALEYYKKAVLYDNANYYYKASLGSLYLEFGQYTDAIEIYESLVKNNPDKVDLYLYLSEAYRMDGNLPKSIEALDNIEKMVGLNEKISMQKFQLYSALDNKKRAYAEFQKYIEKYPTEIKYYVFLGNIYLQDNNTEEAYSVFSKAKSIDPDDPYLIAAMANYYEKTGQKAKAEEELKTAILSPKLDIDTKLSIVGQYIGTLHLNDGNTDRANAILDTLVVEYPQEPKLNFMYGNLLMLQKKTEEAQFHFRIFAESDPSNPMGWEQLLRTVSPDSIDQSIDICKTAISYIPDGLLFYFYWGIGEYQKKELKKSLSVLNEGVSHAAPDENQALLSEFYGMIGSIYYEMKESDSSFIAFKKALQYNPQNLGVLNNYSYYLSLERKDLDKAEKMSALTVKAEPTNPTYLDTYGWILFEQGDYVSAKIYLKNAVRYSEEKEKEVSSEVLEHYGDVLFKTGQEEEALEYWKKAKEKGDSESVTLERKIETKTYIAE